MGLLVFYMSLSGTLILLCYEILISIFRFPLKTKWRQMILRMSIVFFVFPFPYFKYFFLSVIKCMVSSDHVSGNMEDNLYRLNRHFLIFMDKKTIMFSKLELLVTFFQVFCILLACLKLFFELKKLFLIRRILKKYSQKASQEELKKFELIKADTKISQYINLLDSDYIAQPLTTGVFCPIILMPKKLNISEDARERILCHELAHIQNKDILWYLISVVVITIHWYNPFCYLLSYRLSEVNELCSDEVAVSTLDHKQKIEYCETIIAVSAEQDTRAFSTIAGFSGLAENQIKRRIDEIMKTKTTYNKKAASILGASLFGLAIAVGFLYQSPQVIYANEIDSDFDEHSEEAFIKTEFACTSTDQLIFDESFIDVNGNIIEYSDNLTKVPCIHDYIDGTRRKHSKKKNGGCVTKYYNAKMCSICHRVESGSLYKTETYEKCPH